MAQKIGIWGGSFDPVHIGHLILAQEALTACNLDRLIWVPSGDPPHRAGPVASGEDRLHMVSCVVQNHDAFSVSDLEVRRSGSSYTSVTLKDIRAEACDAADLLYLLIGADNAVDFNQWFEPDRVMDLAQVVVFDRPGVSRGDVPPELADRMIFLDTPQIEISSTTVRERVRQDVSIKYWVPEPVLNHIDARGLYR